MLLKTLKRVDLPKAKCLSKEDFYHLIIIYVLISAPMVTILPIWLSLIILLTVLSKLIAIKLRWKLSKWLTLSAMLLYIFIAVVNYKGLGIEYFGVALLFVFSSLKILEAKEERDAFMLMLVNLLLMIGVLMGSDGPLLFIYVLFCFFYNIYICIYIGQPKDIGISWKHNLRAIIKILLVSLPFVVSLFFLFPRLNPLWQHPITQQKKTGLSDEMTPNSLSDLVKDGSLAFRVKFADNNIPKNRLLYWRGPVLNRFNGKTWSRSLNNKENINYKNIAVDNKTAVKYTIYHNGETGKWLVPLDIPAKVPKNTRMSNSYEISMIDNSGLNSFDLLSYTSYFTPPLTREDIRYNTLLPANIFPKARKLAKKIAQNSNSVGDFANRVMDYYNKNDFYYDLSPPVGNSDIDSFLFSNRIGYCEHYASSFVFMMRSQGVPSRVVTGYQGGEMNYISGEMEVRQYNAHAWAEVYITGKGWVRYDPTAAVAPERVNRGTPFGSAGNTDLIRYGARLENSSKIFKELSSRFRAIQSFWQNWIIGYGVDKQNSIWERTGLSKYKDIIWIAFIIFLMFIMSLLIFLYRYRQKKYKGDKIYKIMQPFIKAMEKNGIIKPSYQPWLNFIKENKSIKSEKPYAIRVIEQYYKLRYSDIPIKNQDVKDLERKVNYFVNYLNNSKL